MREFERKPTQFLHETDELRKLITENPELPLLVFAGGDCNIDDNHYVSCYRCNAYIGEFLDCMQEVNDTFCYTDRDEFREDIESSHYDFEGTDEEFDRLVESELAEYEPYWKPCIILFVDN